MVFSKQLKNGLHKNALSFSFLNHNFLFVKCIGKVGGQSNGAAGRFLKNQMPFLIISYRAIIYIFENPLKSLDVIHVNICQN